ncbi:hypothetical protein Trco_003113 [Trichoderma cornu-damae]|uniref:Uncharacterized protein n=1 Tax=Trichoderma cornu-damae TaxID=654480 RepID=A0A9P8QW75_9HYPO|nr:hypothetical protein Trco_003113 [Trichoderma cornu-damae]
MKSNVVVAIVAYRSSRYTIQQIRRRPSSSIHESGRPAATLRMDPVRGTSSDSTDSAQLVQAEDDEGPERRDADVFHCVHLDDLPRHRVVAGPHLRRQAGVLEEPQGRGHDGVQEHAVRLVERRGSEEDAEDGFAVQDGAPGVAVLEVEVDDGVDDVVGGEVVDGGYGRGASPGRRKAGRRVGGGVRAAHRGRAQAGPGRHQAVLRSVAAPVRVPAGGHESRGRRGSAPGRPHGAEPRAVLTEAVGGRRQVVAEGRRRPLSRRDGQVVVGDVLLDAPPQALQQRIDAVDLCLELQAEADAAAGLLPLEIDAGAVPFCDSEATAGVVSSALEPSSWLDPELASSSAMDSDKAAGGGGSSAARGAAAGPCG